MIGASRYRLMTVDAGKVAPGFAEGDLGQTTKFATENERFRPPS
jgi:hypothetical protein